MEVEAIAATTPDVSLAAPDVGQPALGGEGTPEAQQLQPDMQLEPTPEEQWFLKAETGTVYKTPEAAAAGIAEKDRFIERLLAERGQWQQPHQAAQPPAEIDPFTDPQFVATVGLIEKRLMQKPEWRAAGAEAIREQAEISAIAAMVSKDMTVQETRAQQRQTEAITFFDQNKALLTSQVGNEVFDRAKEAGRPFTDPVAHKDAVELECYRRGIDPKTMGARPQGSMGVNGAVQYQQQAQQRIFSTANGTGSPMGQGMPPRVQAAVEYYTTNNKNATPEDIERVRNRALANEERFKR